MISPKLLSAVLILTLIAVFTGSNSNAESNLVEGLVRLKKGNKAKAYPKLEAAFVKTSSPKKKAFVALSLAFANPKYLKKRTRLYYARFAYKSKLELETKDKARLLRIIGDDSFDMAEFVQSRNAYEALLKQPELSNSDAEYATLKLGWLYVNQKQPQQAVQLWDSWLSGSSKGDLQDMLYSDLARVWTEYRLEPPKEGTAEGLPFPRSLAKVDQDRIQDVVRGTMKGARRTSPVRPITTLRLVSGTPIATPVLNEFMKGSELSGRLSCRAVTPILDADPKLVDTTAALNTL